MQRKVAWSHAPEDVGSHPQMVPHSAFCEKASSSLQTKGCVQATEQVPEELKESTARTAKMRTLGNIRLIAELFKKSVVPEKIVLVCVQDLMGDPKQEPSENNVEVCHHAHACHMRIFAQNFNPAQMLTSVHKLVYKLKTSHARMQGLYLQQNLGICSLFMYMSSSGHIP